MIAKTAESRSYLYVPPLLVFTYCILMVIVFIFGPLLVAGLAGDAVNASDVASIKPVTASMAGRIGRAGGFEDIGARAFTVGSQSYALVDFEGRTYSCNILPLTGEVIACAQIGTVLP